MTSKSRISRVRVVSRIKAFEIKSVKSMESKKCGWKKICDSIWERTCNMSANERKNQKRFLKCKQFKGWGCRPAIHHAYRLEYIVACPIENENHRLDWTYLWWLTSKLNLSSEYEVIPFFPNQCRNANYKFYLSYYYNFFFVLLWLIRNVP